MGNDPFSLVGMVALPFTAGVAIVSIFALPFMFGWWGALAIPFVTILSGLLGLLVEKYIGIF